jgi:ADP-heptose:LPS heptosyltransferase
MKLSEVKFDCRHFRGEIPCKPNKLRDKVCPTCDEYNPILTRILIIKLGALGDVIRSTPLITRFRKIFPGAHFTWITLSPSILPADQIDKILPFDFKSIFMVRHQKFDVAINLDKDLEACALLQDVEAEIKFGFTRKDNHIAAATPQAEHKLITGFFDNLSKANTKNYLEEIFEICGLDFEGEEYLLNYNAALAEKWKVLRQQAGEKKIIGLNTGCGKRWLTRLWPEEYWLQLIGQLQQQGYYPVLLGGPDEDAMNISYAKKTSAYYPGTFSLEEFIALSSHCDVILTAVSMMMHIAIGLKVPLVLFNNIFNPHEFELYGRGVIVQPSTGCDDYFGNTCSRERHCMKDLPVEEVMNAIVNMAAHEKVHPA